MCCRVRLTVGRRMWELRYRCGVGEGRVWTGVKAGEVLELVEVVELHDGRSGLKYPEVKVSRMMQ